MHHEASLATVSMQHATWAHFVLPSLVPGYGIYDYPSGNIRVITYR